MSENHLAESPFHPGEQAIQSRCGVREQAEDQQDVDRIYRGEKYPVRDNGSV
jgi:hypothetical protein